MKKEDRKKFLSEASQYLKELRREPSLAMHEMMWRALSRAEAKLEDIGTNQDEINGLLQIDAGCAIGMTTVTCDSRRTLMRQAILNECTRIVEKLRTEPALDKLTLIKKIIEGLGAKTEDVGTTNEELIELTRQTYIAEMKEDIQRYGRENDSKALSQITKHLGEQFQTLKTHGLSTDDILGLLQEVHSACEELNEKNSLALTPHDLN